MRLIYLAPLALSAFSVYANDDSLNLDSLDLESLMATDVQVTAAMKRLQSTSETAASIYVLSNQELVKSGVTSIPQALTMVPGLQVRKIDNNVWAITARATAGRYSSRLLVMVDGQSIHNPGFAGVDWEGINVPIFDIERIEVVRGQSGLLWGSNATNGVINIITKHSEDTRTVNLQVNTGSQLDHQVTGRLGSDLGEYGSYRVYASNRQSDKSSESLRGETSDYGETSSFGMRSDVIINDDVSFIFEGDYTQVDNGQTVSLSNQDTHVSERLETEFKRRDVKLMNRFEHRITDLSNQMVQIAYSGLEAESAYNDERYDIIDAEYQMNTLISNVRFDWGLNYQYTKIGGSETDYISTLNELDSTQNYGAFVQAQFEIVPDELTFSIGNRSEHNDFTGWEHQPIARLTWLPTRNHVVWSSVSQGVRIPSLIEQNGLTQLSGQRVGDVFSTGNASIDDLYVPLYLYGNEDIEAESTISGELGYRFLQHDWNFDLSLFRSESKNALALEVDDSSFTTIAEAYALASITNDPQDWAQVMSLLSSSSVDYTFVSNAHLTTYGTEAVFGWQPNENVKAEIGYSYTSYEYDLEDGTRNAVGSDADMSQLFFKASTALTHDHYLFALYRYENGDAYDTSDFGVLDISWSWMINPIFAFSLTGNNLLAGDHLEYGNTDETFTVPTYIESSVVARITANF